MGVDDECVSLVVAELEQVPRNPVLRRTLAIGANTGKRLGPQPFDIRVGPVGPVRGGADRFDWPGAREQQVALDQVSEPEVRRYADQAFDVLERGIDLPADDLLEHGRK